MSGGREGTGKPVDGSTEAFLRPRCCSADVSFVRFADRGRRPEGEAHSECDYASPDSDPLEVRSWRQKALRFFGSL
jgi:hypothetical protein